MARRRRKRKMRKRALKTFAVLFLLVAIVATLLVAPMFNITSISINGTSKLSENEILATSGIFKGGNVFRTNISKSAKQIETLPYVDKAVIKRKYPARIEINITESTMFAKVISNGEFIGIDRAGKVLEITADNNDGIMLISGITVINAQPGQKIVYEEADMLEIQSSISDKLEENDLIGKIKQINLENRSFITLSTYDGLDTYIGTCDELDYKIKLFSNILNQGYTVGIFDVSNTAQPTFRKNK